MNAKVVNIKDFLPTIDSPEMEEDDYGDFLEDLTQLGLKASEVADRLGVKRSTVYSWKRHGVPLYAHAYLDVLMQLYDAEIRLGKRKPEV